MFESEWEGYSLGQELVAGHAGWRVWSNSQVPLISFEQFASIRLVQDSDTYLRLVVSFGASDQFAFWE